MNSWHFELRNFLMTSRARKLISRSCRVSHLFGLVQLWWNFLASGCEASRSSLLPPSSFISFCLPFSSLKFSLAPSVHLNQLSSRVLPKVKIQRPTSSHAPGSSWLTFLDRLELICDASVIVMLLFTSCSRAIQLLCRHVFTCDKVFSNSWGFPNSLKAEKITVLMSAWFVNLYFDIIGARMRYMSFSKYISDATSTFLQFRA